MPALFLFVGLLISIFGLLVTGASAFVGPRRCKPCGHLFYNAGQSEQEKANTRAGIRYAVLSGAILFLSFVIGPNVIMLASGGISEPADIMMAMSAVIWLLIAGACLLCNATVWLILKERIKNRLVWALLFMLPAVTLSFIGVRDALPSVRARKALSAWELAPLPKSARRIRFYRKWWPDAERCYLAFRANPQEIETFLNTSPRVRADEFESFSNENSALSSSIDLSTLAELRENDRGLCALDDGAPEWHKLQVRGPGRRYIVLEGDRKSFGEIIVDDEEHIVFVRLGWGD